MATDGGSYAADHQQLRGVLAHSRRAAPLSRRATSAVPLEHPPAAMSAPAVVHTDSHTEVSRWRSFGYGCSHEPSQMIGRQPIPDVRRQQKPLFRRREPDSPGVSLGCRFGGEGSRPDVFRAAAGPGMLVLGGSGGSHPFDGGEPCGRAVLLVAASCEEFEAGGVDAVDLPAVVEERRDPLLCELSWSGEPGAF